MTPDKTTVMSNAMAVYKELNDEHRAYVNGLIDGLTMATQTNQPTPEPTPAN